MGIIKFQTPKPGDPRTHTSINDITDAIEAQSTIINTENLRHHGLDATNFAAASDVMCRGTGLAQLWHKEEISHAGNFSAPDIWEIGAQISTIGLYMNRAIQGTDDAVIRIRASCECRRLKEGQKIAMAVGFQCTGTIAGHFLLTNSIVWHGAHTTSSLGDSGTCLSTVGALSSTSLAATDIRMSRFYAWFFSGKDVTDAINIYNNITLDAVLFKKVTHSDTDSQRITVTV